MNSYRDHRRNDVQSLRDFEILSPSVVPKTSFGRRLKEMDTNCTVRALRFSSNIDEVSYSDGKDFLRCGAQELIILFLFSFLFNLSTLFLCILASSCSYLSFSSFFARFSFIAAILSCARC